MDYKAAIEWLYGTQLFGIKLGLENVRRLLGELGLFDALAGRKVIHVAGTNGKGSVCAMADAMLRASGKRCGLFTSPHLVSFRERIRVNGEMMPESAIAEALTDIRERIDDWDPHPTFFEITLALAVKHFCDRNCEVIVLETGMGGRLDATNALASDVAVITPIGLDHTQWLGETLTAIAGEKAGIIKAGKPVISAPQTPEAAAVIDREAEEKNAPLTWIRESDAPAFSLSLPGAHQKTNAAIAIAAAKTIDPELSDQAIAQGLASVEWPARFQRITDRVTIDGAHNYEASLRLAETWQQEMGPDTKAVLIFGGVETKDTSAVMQTLAPLASRWIFVKVASQRGLTLDHLEAKWNDLRIPGIPTNRADNVADALEKAADAEHVLVAGSLYLAGEAIAAIRGGSPFEVSEQ